MGGNMAELDRMVGITADGLVVIRSGPQAKYLGLDDPFAGWFVTEGCLPPGEAFTVMFRRDYRKRETHEF
jgi:hypothetical protein